MPENVLFSSRVSHSLAINDPDWNSIEPVAIDREWDGKLPEGGISSLANSTTEIRSTWTSREVSFNFENTFDSLNVNSNLGEGGPIDLLWNHDVVGVFLKPLLRTDYFEFQVSPLGQWQDVHILKPREAVDFDWRSNFESAVLLDRSKHLWKALLKIPFYSLRQSPESPGVPRTGDSWRVNLFRIAGPSDCRHYLSWRPTFTEEPDFHIPGAFGHLIFIEAEAQR